MSWGTSPDQTLPITGTVPDPATYTDPAQQAKAARALAYMGLAPGTALQDVPIDHVFLGSCTNGRIEDFRAAAAVLAGRRVAPGVRALAVPGSAQVQRHAEDEGLDRVFLAAGFEWRSAGCSLCVAMNDDRLPPGARCASTSNRNFEGRQGVGARDPSAEPGDGRGRGSQRPPDRRARAAGVMAPWTPLRSVAAALPDANIDTDVIFPARFLLITEKRGLGRHVFHDKRHRADGTPDPAFVLNRPPFDRAQILVAGDNFGCGSSREQAPWALRDFGVRCLVSTSYGEIFAANCINNGILPIRVPADALPTLLQAAADGAVFDVDLSERRLEWRGDGRLVIDLPEAQRQALLSGRDEIATILAEHGDAIAVFETDQRSRQPWLHDRGAAASEDRHP